MSLCVCVSDLTFPPTGRSSFILFGCLHRYPIQSPRPGCYGDREDTPGVRNYGNRATDELFDVYCFAESLKGMIGHHM